MLAETPFHENTAGSAKMLLVAQPDSTGHPALPNARLEVECVRKLIPPGSFTNLPDAQGISIDAIMAHVTGTSILHLACHGHQDRQNPLNSGFDLEDGRLTTGQLMRVSTPNAQLAYLSACESASMDESRPDIRKNRVCYVGLCRSTQPT